jgi:hypothetical protein
MLLGTANSGPPATLKIELRGCPIYARDGRIAKQMMHDGRTQDQVVQYWQERRGSYTPEQWPFAMQLIKRAFNTTATPEEYYNTLLKECVLRDGLLVLWVAT